MSYVVNYNPETKLFEVIKGRKSNTYGYDFPTESSNYIVGIAEDLNDMVREGTAEVIRCKDCSQYYILFKDEKDWFVTRGLSAPKRCLTCRQANKIRRESNGRRTESKGKRYTGVQSL